MFGSKNFYITKYYIQYTIIVLSGLSLFFVVIDYAQVGKTLPASANLQILYFYYKLLHAISILFPISLIFGAVLTFAKLIKENYIVAFYSLGYSEKDLLTPIFTNSIILTFIFISLYTTSFSYSKNIADQILKGNSLNYNSKNLFFKYDTEVNGQIKNYFVFFSKLYPVQKLAEGVRLFNLNSNGEISEVITAKHAYYFKNKWVIYSAKIIKHSPKISLNKKAFDVQVKEKIYVLNGFKPKILDRIYESEMDLNLLDLIDAIQLLYSQGFNIEKLKVNLYNIVIYPFFAPILIVLLFKFMPISSRFSNIGLYVFSSIVSSLLVWGVLFALIKLSFTGNLIVEFAITLPILILALIAIYIV